MLVPHLVLRISGQGATGLRSLCSPNRDAAWQGEGEKETEMLLLPL